MKVQSVFLMLSLTVLAAAGRPLRGYRGGLVEDDGHIERNLAIGYTMPPSGKGKAGKGSDDKSSKGDGKGSSGKDGKGSSGKDGKAGTKAPTTSSSKGGKGGTKAPTSSSKGGKGSPKEVDDTSTDYSSSSKGKSGKGSTKEDDYTSTDDSTSSKGKGGKGSKVKGSKSSKLIKKVGSEAGKGKKAEDKLTRSEDLEMDDPGY